MKTPLRRNNANTIKMKIKDFGFANHILLRGRDEFERKEGYKFHSLHLYGTNCMTCNFSGQAANLIITAILMTEDDLPKKINSQDFSFCFQDNQYDIRKSFFICKIDSSNNILDSKHYSHHTDLEDID